MDSDLDDPIAKREKAEAKQFLSEPMNDLPLKFKAEDKDSSEFNELLDTMSTIEEKKNYYKK